MRNYDLNPLRRSSAGSDRPLIDGSLHDKGEDKCPPRNIVPLAQRAFPPDTTAIIYRPARSAMTSGKANTRRWQLRFEQRAAPFIEPLMGWTAGTDTLSQVELDFPSAEAAIAYAKRQGINFVVQGLAEPPGAQGPTSDKPKPGDPDQLAAHDRRPRTRKLEWMERTLGVPPTNDGIDLDRALTHPAATFDEPERVVRHPQLSPEQKRDVLRRWALEAYRTDGARTQAFAQSDSARLDKVIDALIDLDEPGGLVVIKRKDTGSAAVHVGPATPLAGHEYVRDVGGQNDGAEMERIRC
jgi:hypothetical protein